MTGEPEQPQGRLAARRHKAVSRFALREQTRDMKPRDAAWLIVVVWLLAVVIWGIAEHFVDPKTFPTVWLGMWWALETVTTVGYGDVVPQQTDGRILASLLLLGGLAFISVVTASITTGFVARRERQMQESGDDPVLQQLEAISERLLVLEQRLLEQEQETSDDPPEDSAQPSTPDGD